MSEPKEPKVPTDTPVLGTVDICDRPIPNRNPSPGMTDANYQDSYFEEPDYEGGATEKQGD